jgi:O-antigen/teichoic acid export membrane protein
MRIREVATNTIVAFSAQGISVVLSALTSLLVPKVLGVTEFGYWQLFIFYTTYSGLFHFGLNDGVYLINGGKKRSELNKEEIKGQFIVGMTVQSLFAVAICLVAIFGGFGEKRAFVIFLTGIYMVLYNLSSYLGYVFQAINETKLFSYSVMIDKLVFLIPLSYLLIAHTRQFEWYAASYAVSKLCALIFCIWKGRDILSAGTYLFSESVKLAIRSVRVGINLMVANIASMLILGVARFAIDYKWGIEVFGKLSFSLSLVNFFIQFVSQASMVLFPALRQSSESELRNVYLHIRDIMELCFPVVYILYFPIVWIMRLWLPAYADSLEYFILLIPLCLYNTKMDICCTTYFKVLRKERILLKINLATVTFSSILVLAFTFLYPSVYLILASVIVAIILRSLLSEVLINRQLGVPSSSLAIYEILLTVAFIILTFTLADLAALIVYFVIYAGYLAINKRQLSDELKTIKRGIGR